MKTVIAWLLFVVLSLLYPLPHRWAAFNVTAVAIAGAFTSIALQRNRNKLRGAFSAWQTTNNERHRALALVERRERACTAALELLEMERKLAVEAHSRLKLLKEFTDKFVTPETIRERLQKLAVEFKRRCDLQQAFYRSAGERINGGTSGFEGEDAIAASEASFNDVKRLEAVHRMLVDEAKRAFWKQHDLVGQLIALGLLPPEYRVLEGKSFTKYLPSEQGELQKLGVHAEGANEQPGQ